MSSKNLSAGLQSYMIPGNNYGYTGVDLAGVGLQSFENTI